jgi:hypothetical protein
MRLGKLTEFRSLVFTPDSAPTLATLRARIDEIPGGTIQLGRYFVDLDEYDRATKLRASIDARQRELAAAPELQGLA